MRAREVYERMLGKKTFRETGLQLTEVRDAFAELLATVEPYTRTQADAMAELYQQLEEKNKLIANLKESNKKYRSENKKLRSERE